MRDYFNWFLYLVVGLPLVAALEVMFWLGGEKFSESVRSQHAKHHLRKVAFSINERKRREVRALGRQLERQRKNRMRARTRRKK